MRRLLYHLFGWKRKDINYLKDKGVIVDGKVETSITKDGIVQDIFIQPVKPVDFIVMPIKIEKP